MTKEDLKTGDIVITRGGTYYMYFENYAGHEKIFIGIFCSNYMSVHDFDSNMKNRYGCSINDIVKVYTP